PPHQGERPEGQAEAHGGETAGEDQPVVTEGARRATATGFRALLGRTHRDDRGFFLKWGDVGDGQWGVGGAIVLALKVDVVASWLLAGRDRDVADECPVPGHQHDPAKRLGRDRGGDGVGVPAAGVDGNPGTGTGRVRCDLNECVACVRRGGVQQRRGSGQGGREDGGSTLETESAHDSPSRYSRTGRCALARRSYFPTRRRANDRNTT